MKVIDNFLNEEDFTKLKNIILKYNFPWYYNDFKTTRNDSNFQFIHHFFNNDKITSNYWKYILPIITKLKATSIIRIKANLTTNKSINYKSDMHIDTKVEKSKTAVFYCNSNNGFTLFQNGKKIISKENRIVIFDGHQKHCGADCTDQNTRVVINFNFFVDKI